MKTLKINFVDFWPNFQKNDNYFYNLLATKYKVVVDENDPDLLFFSVDYSRTRERDRFLNHRCKKIFFSGENVSANLDVPGSIEYPRYSIGKCDFAFTFEYNEDPRQCRLPLWVMFINWFGVSHKENRDISYLIPLEDLLIRRPVYQPKFCNFVFSNNAGRRLEILHEMMQYKKVDCAGPLANNMAWRIPGRGDQKNKVDFLRDYRFTIACENSRSDGYTTEKILHPLSVGSLPIYWGSSQVTRDFNNACFINVDDFKTLKDLATHVKLIDSNEDLLHTYMTAPVFPDNEIPLELQPDTIATFFEEKILC